MVVGLTGGIGSGKSTIAKFFEEKGIPVFIADLAGRNLLATHEMVKKEVIQLLGTQAYDEHGTPNRRWIGQQVFGNKKRLEELNKIIHPRVARAFEDWKLQQKAPYLLYETAILFEKKLQERCDYTILVTASKAARIKRLQQRDQSSVKEIEKRMAQQWSDHEKIPLADFIIQNTTLKHAKKESLKIHKVLLNIAIA